MFQGIGVFVAFVRLLQSQPNACVNSVWSFLLSAVALDLLLCLCKVAFHLQRQQPSTSEVAAGWDFFAVFRQSYVLEEVLCAFALNVWSCLQMKVLMLERRELNLFSDYFFFNAEAQFNCILFSSMQVKTPKMGETAEIKKNPRRKATKTSWSLGSRCRCPLSRAFTSHYLRTRAMWPPRSRRQVKRTELKSLAAPTSQACVYVWLSGRWGGLTRTETFVGTFLQLNLLQGFLSCWHQ